jgi:hypothetical protein
MMKAKQEDNAEDDGGEKNLSNVVIEDLLVGVGRVMKVGVLLRRCFVVDDGIHGSGCVLSYVHCS